MGEAEVRLEQGFSPEINAARLLHRLSKTMSAEDREPSVSQLCRFIGTLAHFFWLVTVANRRVLYCFRRVIVYRGATCCSSLLDWCCAERYHCPQQQPRWRNCRLCLPPKSSMSGWNASCEISDWPPRRIWYVLLLAPIRAVLTLRKGQLNRGTKSIIPADQTTLYQLLLVRALSRLDTDDNIALVGPKAEALRRLAHFTDDQLLEFITCVLLLRMCGAVHCWARQGSSESAAVPRLTRFSSLAQCQRKQTSALTIC
jgi:hypothetical protein